MKNLLSFRKAWLTLSFALGMVLLAAAQPPTKGTASSRKATASSDKSTSALLGTWLGTFSGSASGNCELRLAQDAGGKPTGQLSIQPDGGEPSPFIIFESVTLEGSHLKATFTDGQGAKSELDGTLENDQLKGSWKTASGQEGSWQTTKAGKE
jgi:hypothetical protein